MGEEQERGVSWVEGNGRGCQREEKLKTGEAAKGRYVGGKDRKKEAGKGERLLGFRGSETGQNVGKIRYSL